MAMGKFGLGLRYLEGRGVPKDKPQGIAWIRNAAEQGNAFAEFYLGIAYGVGDGVPQDFARAATWHRKAADHGETGSQNTLAQMYRDGQGVPQDYIRAHMWFNWAAAGTSDASFHNKLAYSVTDPVVVDTLNAAEAS
jgi:TPR repeat protein